MKQKNILFFVIYIMMFCFLFLRCSHKNLSDLNIEENENFNEINAQWSTGVIRGHEDLTRFGIDLANKLIKEKFSIDNYYEQAIVGEFAPITTNPIVRGNYLTDFPTDELKIFHLESTNVNWNSDPRTQNIHSLRAHENGVLLQSAFQACLGFRNKVFQIVYNALIKFSKGDFEGGLTWLGHATHSIQDSFSPVHAKRTDDLKYFLDFCTYGKKFEGICKHDLVDIKDYIWKSNMCFLRSWDCLTDEAKQASKSTAGFLFAIYLIIEQNADVKEVLNSFFDSNEMLPYSGYHNCSQLDPNEKLSQKVE